MRGVNKVILLGNATRDAALRHTSSGKAVSSLRLATNRTVGDHEETQYHTIICWEALAETTSKYVKTGDPLYVEGRLQYRSYQDEEGKERGVAEIVASDVQFLGRRAGVPPASSHTATGTDTLNEPAPDQETVSPDEIPF